MVAIESNSSVRASLEAVLVPQGGSLVCDVDSETGEARLYGMTNTSGVSSPEGLGNLGPLLIAVPGHLPHHAETFFRLAKRAGVLESHDALTTFPPIATEITTGEESNRTTIDSTRFYENYVKAIADIIASRNGRIDILASSLGGVIVMDALKIILENQRERSLENLRSITFLNAPLTVGEITATLESITQLEAHQLTADKWKSVYPNSEPAREALLGYQLGFIKHPGASEGWTVNGNGLAVPEHVQITCLSTSLVQTSEGKLKVDPSVDPIIDAGLTFEIDAEGYVVGLRALGGHRVNFVPLVPRERGDRVNAHPGGHLAATTEIPKIAQALKNNLTL